MCETLLKSICRLCLKDDFSLRCIFTCRSPSLEPVSHILENIYDLKICEGDGLPSNICLPCFSKVIEFDIYRKNVGHAEEELRKLLFRTCNKSNEVSDEGTDTVTELTAEREMVSAGFDFEHKYANIDVHTEELAELQNVAKDPMEGIENDTNVPIKNEIDIDEWVMPQDMLPEKDNLENVESAAEEEVLKETEDSNKYFIEIEEQQQDEIQSEKVNTKVSAGIDFEHKYANIDVHTEELEELQNVAKDPMEGIDNDINVPIKNEIDIEEWVMPQDMLPAEDILENVESAAGEDILKETEVSGGINIEHNYAENDRQTEELQSSESCDINSSECLGQMDKNSENESSINNSSIVITSGISGKDKANKEIYEESVKNDLFAEKESFFSTKSKSGDNSAKSGSSSSGMAVQSKRKSFACDICKKSFVTKWHLSQHIRIHYDDRPFKCRECGQSFKQYKAKIMHELRHLKKYNENGGDKKRKTKKSFVCEICKKEFSSQLSLYNHSNLHKNKYTCTFCGKRCSSKHLLNIHFRIHTNEKPFSCEVCKKTFNQKGCLKRHLVTHSDNRSFQCNVCDKKFKTKQRMNDHELYHLRKK